MRLKAWSDRRPVQLAAISLLVGALVIGGFTLPSSPAHAESGIAWTKQVDKGLQQAKDEHKYVLADVYTDWCGWCKRLDQQTFSNEGVSSYLSGKFVCIKVNAEDRGEGTKLAQKYKVSGFPCALVFDQQGKYIGKIVGFLPPEEYQAKITSLIENPPANPEM
jgi:thiol:disulfide interchange protein